MTNKLGETTPEKIVLLRALQLGDLLCTVPSFRALRAAFPKTSLTLIGLPWMKTFVERFHDYLDDYIEFPGFPGFPEQTPRLDQFPDFLTGVQTSHYNLAIQMQGSGGISNPLTVLFGARLNAGLYLPGQYCPDPDRFLAYPVHEHEVWRHLRLLEFLGIPLQGDALEFPIYPSDWDELQSLEEYNFISSGNYVVIHAGARERARRWPVEYYASVADGLGALGYQIVLTGTQDERPLAAELVRQIKAPVIDLAGKTNLGTLAALLSGARLIICNDTGVSHLAAALRLPSVVLFTASDPERWAPLDGSLHRVVAWATATVPKVVLDDATSLLDQEPMHAS